MPSIRAVLERLKFEVEKGNANESVHVVFVEREQKERIKNNNRKTRFVLCTDDPDLCSQFEEEKDRIIKRVKNKSIALTLMVRAWEEALPDATLDKILAAMEGPPI